MLELYKHVTFSEKPVLTVCKCLSIKRTNCFVCRLGASGRICGQIVGFQSNEILCNSFAPTAINY